MNHLNKIILLFILTILMSPSAHSQTSKVQSLLEEALKTEQTASSSVGNRLAKWLQVYNEIENQKKHPQYPNVCIAIANIYSQELLHEQALPYYLSALEALQKGGTANITQVELHRQLANNYAHQSKLDSALIHYNILLKTKEKTNNTNGQINTLRDIAATYMDNKMHDKALEYNLKIKNLLEQNNYSDSEKIKIYNNIGYNYNQMKDYEQSISFFKEALKLIEKDDYLQKIILNTNIGVAYYNMEQFDSSIDHLLTARSITQKKTPVNLDEINQLLATVYLKKNDLYNALGSVKLSEKVAKEHKRYPLLVDVYYTSALIYSELYEYDMALEYYQKHLHLRDSIELDSKLRQEKLLLQQIDLERREKEIKLFLMNEDVQELTIAQLKAEKENQELALKNKEAELLAEQKRKEVLEKEKELLNKNNEILNNEKELLNKDNEIKVGQAERARKDLEIARQNLRVAQQEKAYEVLQEQEKRKALELQQKESQLLAEQNEKELLLTQAKNRDLELQTQAERLKFFSGLGFLLGFIIFIIFLKNRAIERQKQEINEERKKANELLLNILPAQVANELKETGKATTKKYDNVSILFTDFQGFTELVASIPATVLITELNDMFSRFDDIMDEFQIEKIETIGDAYLAACGLPKENEHHALKCVQAAHKMVAFLEERNKTSKIKWNMRVGVHSGPVVAGVVGKKKFAYDIFGDTVNTASRMESNSEAGRVNISQTTYELIKHHPHFDFEDRGEIFAKGKGEVNMWFVNELA